MPRVITNELIDELLKDSELARFSSYKEANAILDLRCKAKGHKVPTSYANISPSGVKRKPLRCRVCHNWGNSKKLSQKEAERRAEERGYKLVSKYVRSKDKIELICPKSHRIKMRASTFFCGARCGICCGVLVTNEMIDKALSGTGWERVGDYVKQIAPLEFRYLGELKQMRWDSLRNKLNIKIE